MALFHKRITEAIKRQRVREAEAEKETAAERFRLVRDAPRRQDIGAGPPDDRPIWTKETVTDPDTGESLEGWLREGEGVVWPQGIKEADTPEESLPCLYLEIGMVHDWTEENWELKHGRPPRPKLLAGFDLPDEITDKNVSWADHFVGKYCPGVFPSEDRDRRRQIERALDDVKGDLAIEQGKQAGGSGSLPAQGRKAAHPVPPTTGARDKVFISYSHKDKKFLGELQTHLKPLIREECISIWSDEQIEPGAKWFEDIKLALATTKVAVLLVTKDFLASDFIHEHELGPLLKEAEQGRVKIHWVPVSNCNFKATPLKDYQARIPPDKPLGKMTKAERDGAWVKICEAIKAAL